MKIPLAYDWGVALYLAAIRLASLFNPKARRWQQGRRHWERDLREAVATKLPQGRRRIWIHCASLGEFEQGRPLIEALRNAWPEDVVLLSFFSPSGYDIRKDYPLADHVCYLPPDKPRQVNDFLNALQPDLAVFVKYEFWLHMLAGLYGRGIPIILVSAAFRPRQVFFRWYGRAWRNALGAFRHIFVQDAASMELLRKHGIDHCTVAGDTRVDRVIQMAAEGRRIPIVETFAGEAPVLVAGSTWPQDEDLLACLWKQVAGDEGWKLIVAPHHISEPGLRRLENILPAPSVRFSQAKPEAVAGAGILIIDNIGMLSALYRYGRMAYVGGGFGAGIHNTLEPMAFGLPVIFGPEYRKFREAVEMIQAGGSRSVKQAAGLTAAFRHYASDPGHSQGRKAAEQYLAQNKGATARIMDYLAQLK